jgi:2-polyprenyl-3-methyl-5-hydroxy-6-metoxy-1,4-benzoquinol methylase
MTIPAPTNMKKFYDDYYRSTGKTNPAYEIYNNLRIKYIKGLIESDRGSMLIAGCGSGNDLKISSPGLRVFAFDLSLEAVRKIRSFEQEVFVGDVLQLPFRKSQFNLVVCSEVLEHVPNIQSAILELRRVIKPEGVLIVSSPNWHSLFGIGRWAGERLLKRSFHSSDQPYDDWKTYSKFKRELEPYFKILKCIGTWYLPPLHYKKFGLPFVLMKCLYWTYSPFEAMLSKIAPKLGHLIILQCEPTKNKSG